MGNRCFRIAPLVMLAGLLSGGAARAETVDLALVFAVDVSGSVDDEEALLQRDGYIRALTDPRVIAAIQHGKQGRIAATYFEWAGFHYQNTLVDWQVISDVNSAGEFARRIAAAPRIEEMYTSISGAIDFGIRRLAENPHTGLRQAIDISGDGANNSGDLLPAARDRAARLDITINGLPIVNDRPSRFGRRQIANLDLYYRDCVIGGPRAFLIVANGFLDFARAIRRKLILEIADRQPADGGNKPPLIRAALAQSPGCDAGELRMRDVDEF
ncbi:MAG: DUF1194 domain-containing protein [Rhodospirillales bacterium]|nr:DUF1194 domain-containing protein [Rhodospirillales bacterium]